MNQPSLFDWAGGAMPKNRRASQASKIAEWLVAGNSITPLDALEKFGCFRLAARIFDLRRQGMNIVEEDVERDGVRYARYFVEARA